MSEYYTEDLSDFGFRELKMAAELLTAYTSGKSNIDSVGNGLKLAMNRNSGYVFLTDEEYRAYMMNGDILEEFISCSYCGYEGFQKEFKDNKDNCKECKRIFKEGYFSNGNEDLDDDEDNGA